ncbi:hypothetical protein H6G81_17595 [Scytonema hofmannii FACHB-248]|uniref:Outer membrane protein beta-barrel domain-containing protein n=1 Tax=Scytonema hofmannii FACHB-248 TaxID=1842502 RepID=A0ABR8GTA2_9CYAN|nr:MULTISPECIES: hypothetical protein [Nostocales]MBD2606294.1 hypothetical protein [Scytonema hofmannii FACHB-248]
MSNIFFRKRVFCLTSATVAVLSSGLSAVAQTVPAVQQSTQLSTTEVSVDQRSAGVETQSQNFSTVSEDNPVLVSDSTTSPQFPGITTEETANPIVTPVPGTTSTSSAALAAQYPQEQFQPSSPKFDSQVAQADINPGRPTRGGSSYVGIAGNIGISGGDSALGDGNFMVISKIGLSNAISVRPSAVIGDNTAFLIPVTYDFSFQQASDPFSEPLPIAPYVGAGAAIKTGDDTQAAFLVSGGIDVPLNAQFTANAAVNAAFFDETDIGLSIGVGYNFGRF